MEAIQNKMRSRKEIKVEGQSGEPLLIMKGKRARNQLQCHPVLELSPSVHKRFLEAGKLYIDLQKVAVYDQSPLVQCAKCLGFGHTKAVCGEKTATCSYCADKTHEWEKCPRRKQNEEPKCKNCWENGIKTEANHEAFSNKCKVRQKWDEIARSRIAYCYGNDMETGDAPTEVDKTILMIQANLQRSSSTAELLQLATEKGISIALCTVGRQKPVKAAIIVFGDKVEVLHDPQLVTETESAVPLNRQNEAGHHLDLLRRRRGHRAISSERKGLQKSGNRKSDHSWRHKCVEPLVGKPEREDRRGQAYRDFLDEMGLHPQHRKHSHLRDL
ncbi:hypothetical protein EVAR_84215_1 [Eumeta japonica]|uniref:Pre-C2HC domain-containing protein n=1 Tax=Eumeta variegata TaxID=151549 RepID=A0A4C1WT28_EUMVA|nr:hypothetical protein EVAR_84215_1 [Eumeta japonica]